ncbi:MAG: T9SS type A sorting domain-containing protein [Marinilabiliaceae bacterium]|nr:T9SS type A sorting domain-containing protein [Marinilabiliaceae bacterium]
MFKTFFDFCRDARTCVSKNVRTYVSENVRTYVSENARTCVSKVAQSCVSRRTSQSVQTSLSRGTSHKLRMSLIYVAAFAGIIFFSPKLYAQPSGGGAGTEGNPYKIANATHMQQFKDYVDNGNTTYIGDNIHWELTTSFSWNGGKIGGYINYIPRFFRGYFHGNGRIITLGSISSMDYTGFFGMTENARINELTINGSYIDGSSFVGCLIGYAQGITEITDVHVTMGTICDISSVCWGGLIGRLAGTATTITRSSVKVRVRANTSSTEIEFGGLIGKTSSTTVTIKDAIADVEFNVGSMAFMVGGIIGVVEGGTVNLTRVYARTTNLASLGIVFMRGSMVGYLESGRTINYNTFVSSLSATSSNVVGMPAGTVNGNGLYLRSAWTNNTEVYDLLERRNDNNGTYATNQKGNEAWGYGDANSPKLARRAQSGNNNSRLDYVVRVVAGSGISNITGDAVRYSASGVYYLDGRDGYSYLNEYPYVTPSLSPNNYQRREYNFLPDYNSTSLGSGTIDNGGRLATPVNGTVTATIINIPYPQNLTSTFDQFSRDVNLNWTYNNAQGLTGRFFVYRRETAPTAGGWETPVSAGNVTTGASVAANVTYTLGLEDYNKTFEYIVGFVEGTGGAPANPTSINQYRRASTTLNTNETLIQEFFATGMENDIEVSFTADSRFPATTAYYYNIERSENGGAFQSWVSNQSFDGRTAPYIHTDNYPSLACDAFVYRLVVYVSGVTINRVSEEARISGSTRFAQNEPFKSSKGEYPNYVRLQWRVDRMSGGSPEIYRVFRRVANTNDQFIELETITSNAATVYWNDNNALTGVYYEYRVVLYQSCNSEETELEIKTDIGFTQAFGTVLGRVTYGTGTAVPAVNLLVRRNDMQQGESQYYSLRSIGGGQRFEWKASNDSYFNDIWISKQWTLQFWVNPDANITGTKIIGYIGSYPIYLSAVTGGYQVYAGFNTAQRSEIITPNKFSHIVLTRNNNDITIYTVCDNNPDDIYIESITYNFTTATPFITDDCKISFGHELSGYIDEVRFWDRPLAETEITNDYSRRLVGNENGLRAYWTFDENLPGNAFDMSRIGTVYNGNHATTNTLAFHTNVPSEIYQLALKGITDGNGNYQISGIPYSGEGTSYSIVPDLGVHVFNPNEHLRYISPTSMVHNGTDFTDISSFKVSGTVRYEGGNYPVQGCSFEIDEQPVTRPNGSLYTSEFDGSFEISVPIGIHTVRIVKQGHTFVNDGLLTNSTGDDLNYNANVPNVQFWNNTRVKLIGRVVGGMIEDDKPLAFGESINNIGVQDIILESIHLLTYSFSTVPVTETVYHNQGQWKKPGGLSEDQTIVTYNPDNVTISVSPITGEFVAWVYPEPYNIRNILVPAAGGTTFAVYDRYENLNLSNAPVPDDSFLKMSIRTWTDSLEITGQPGSLDYWEYFEVSDTVYHHADWKHFWQATPTFSVTQAVNDEPVDYFGDISFLLRDDLTGENETLPLWNATDGYFFDMPLFTQGNEYTFLFNGFEEYANYAADPNEPDIERYPVKEGRINMTNTVRINPTPETVEMDNNGEAVYSFVAGAPNLATGTNDFFATLTIGGRSYYWNMGQDPVEVWHLGSKSTGTDFMTTGPDQVEIILRDPPGTFSKSYIEAGTTVTSKKSNNIVNGMNQAMNLTTSLGPKIITFAGLGAGVIMESEVKFDISAGLNAEERWSSASEYLTSTTFTERFETSDHPLYVGHHGDVFIGNSTNILYGLTRSITIIKDYENQFEEEEEGETFYDKDDYSIAPAVSLAYGQTFDTRFAFTQHDIEGIMIPKWYEALEVTLLPVGTPVNTAEIDEPVYVSKLAHSHNNFGKLNTDQIFGNEASTPDMFHDGPSYKIFFPDEFDMADFRNDTVMYFNNQINNWTAVLIQNEKEKVEMERLGNYSFGSGVTVEYSKTESTSKTVSSSFNWMLNPTVGLVTGGEVLGIGMELEISFEYVHEEETSQEQSYETVVTSGFILQDEGDDDQISVDYGMTASGTLAFKTRGGRTSCPYEAELVSQYYEPGQHILMEGTMQIEVPKLSVASAPQVLNVPANRDATFLLALENESDTGEDVWFQLLVDEETNPDGAILKIDGGIIGNGRHFMVRAYETLYKTLTVSKGTADVYENIALLLASQCQFDPTDGIWESIADTAFISVEFIPACSNVAILQPNQNWILNADSPTSDTLYVSIADFDVNFPNFGWIRLEQRAVTSPNWSTLMTYYPSHLYPQAQGDKEDIGDRIVLIYPWKTPPYDGAHEIRATAASVNVNSQGQIIEILSTYSTDAVLGYRDMNPPRPLGAPSPADGILTAGDEISITFNEDIQSGLLIKDNFTISGILNAQELAEPNVGLVFNADQHHAKTELPIFVNGSFSIEAWYKRNGNSEGTLFAFGANGNYISLSFSASGHVILKNGNETYTSSQSVSSDDTWKYIAMCYDRDNNSVAVYHFEGVISLTLFTSQSLIAFPETQGKLYVGNNDILESGINCAVSQLHFYGIKRLLADVSADKSLTKSGREHGLIGYWIMDEAEGNIAEDKARARHLTHQAEWYVYPSGYAKVTNGNVYFSIPTATYPLDAFRDFTLEFWFRSENSNIQPDRVLFSADNGYIAITANGGLALYKPDGTLNQVLTTINVINTQWTHFAMSVRRNGSVNVYINGENRASFSETLLGSFASGFFYFGAKLTNNTYSQFFTGYYDEIRLWNSALSRENVILNKNSKLHGNESGLQAYYPFEKYVRLQNGTIEVTPTNENMTDSYIALGTASGFSTTAMSVKDVRPVEYVDFDFVASNNKIVLTISPDYFALVEGNILNISVENVRDMRNNRSNTEQWTAYVRRNALQWDSDPIYLTKEQNDFLTFTAKIVNTGGTTVSYSVENLPSWLTVSAGIGNLQPLQSRELNFTVFQGINIGNYETAVGLTSGNGVLEILPVQLKVTGERPDWYVNLNDFENSMNITGQIKIDGMFQEDPDDILGAFIDDLCVGVTSPTFMSSNNAYFTFANIYGNAQHNNKPLIFKLWDASTGRIYPQIETSINDIHFAPSTIIGNITNPVIFNALDITEQIINLNQGWNWISTNILNENPSIINQMKQSLITSGELIKGRDAFIQQPNWVGNLAEISEKSMYLVKNVQAHALVLTGQPANPATTPININQGWNWIGYVPAITLPVNSALAGIDANIDDQIKGQNGYAVYSGSNGWMGTLTFMQSGKGYMYFSNSGTSQTLIYPSTIPQGIEGMPQMAPPNNTTIDSKWEVNISNYSSTMTMTARVVHDDVELASDVIEIGAFSGDECRGTAFLQYVESLNRYVAFLMIYGNGNEPIKLKVFDHATETEHIANNSTINFASDAIFGNPTNPYMIGLGTTVVDINAINMSQLTVYPNPTSGEFSVFSYQLSEVGAYNIRQIEIFDAAGRLVHREPFTVNRATVDIDISHLENGVYFLRIENETIKIVKR